MRHPIIALILILSACAAAQPWTDQEYRQVISAFETARQRQFAGDMVGARSTLAASAGSLSHGRDEKDATLGYSGFVDSFSAGTYLLEGREDLARSHFMRSLDFQQQMRRRIATRDQAWRRAGNIALVALYAGAAVYSGTQGYSGGLGELPMIPEVPKEEFAQGLAGADGIRMPVPYPNAVTFLTPVGQFVSIADGTRTMCTAEMVGSRIAITAAHCVTDENGVSRFGAAGMNVYFPSLADGIPVTDIITSSGRRWDLAERHDWALLVLKTAPGLGSYGVIGLRADTVRGHLLAAAGHSDDIAGGTLLTLNWGCVARSISAGVVYNSCVVWHGASGGPLLDVPKIVSSHGDNDHAGALLAGIVTRAMNDKSGGSGVSASEFVYALIALRRKMGDPT